MVELIAKAAVRIVGLFALLGMAVLVLGVVGMQMFGGIMRQRCYGIDNGRIIDDSQVAFRCILCMSNTRLTSLVRAHFNPSPFTFSP